MSSIIISVSGIRGILGESLTPQSIIKYTSAFSEFCRKNKTNRIVIGRDGRQHGKAISDMVISCLNSCGFDVIDIGIAPTPTVQIATEDTKSSGGIAVTASHNPQIWNGLKFLNPDGTFLDSKQIKKVINIADKEDFKYAGIKNFGITISDKSWIDKHINRVLGLKFINLNRIKKRNYKIVVDAVNSSGSVIVPKLLKKLNCNIIELFCDSSGIFPHEPEPLPFNLNKLSLAVKRNKADFGIAVDPDSDRLVLITEKGLPYGEEYTITTAVRNVLDSTGKNNPVCVNLSTTRAVDDIAKEYNAKVIRTPVGEINVVREMKKRGSIIGGEGSGGVILPELHYGRDAIAGIVIILNEFSKYSISASEYKKTLPEYHIAKTKFKIKENPDILLSKIRNEYKNKKNCRITQTDGVKLDFKEHWIHLRKSNTEPIVRIITEARTEKKSKEILNTFLEEIINI